MSTPQEILTFWFGELGEDGSWSSEQEAMWFGGGPELDAKIRDRFGADVEAAGRGEYDAWAEDPHERLALILLCDQLTRNVYRGTGQAFSLDPRALALSLEGIDEGMDRALHPIERVFFYLPLEHHEGMAEQRLSMACFERLVRDAPEAQREAFESFLKYAQLHLDLIERFGRFPHRNALLGRTPTPEERAYLSDGGATFGQSADTSDDSDAS